MKNQKEQQAAPFFKYSHSSRKMRVTTKKEKTERYVLYTNEELKNMKNRERKRVTHIDLLDFIVTSLTSFSTGSI